MQVSRFGRLIFAALIAFGFGVAMLEQSPVQAQGITGSNWEGYYWANPNFSGSPALFRIDPAVLFNWATGSPAPGIIPNDNFSARWYNRINFAAGTYRFRAGADDGIRVAINGNVIINRFTPAVGGFTVNTADVVLGAGIYEIIVDYYEGVGEAGVLFDWTVIAGGGEAAPGGNIVPTPAPTAAAPTLKAVVIVDRANIRSGPGTNFPTIGEAFRDQQFKVIGRNGDFGFETWYLLDLGNGARGWMFRQVIYIYGGNPATLPRTREVINAPAIAAGGAGAPADQPPNIQPFEVRGIAQNNALVRSIPSLNGERLGVIPKGASFQILKLSNNQAWVYVAYENLRGWTYVPNIRVTVGRLGVLPRGNTAP
ncbi:MAG: SH3 domain-containing protein [Anaerolineae bacterium]|nr:SH3 domain-containing protein [Anaerolineae bacterium]MDW8299015.1 SH3 domain-containing protein [Anaerolineae bacterium]